MFPNKTITNLMSKQYKKLDLTFLIEKKIINLFLNYLLTIETQLVYKYSKISICFLGLYTTK